MTSARNGCILKCTLLFCLKTCKIGAVMTDTELNKALASLEDQSVKPELPRRTRSFRRIQRKKEFYRACLKDKLSCFRYGGYLDMSKPYIKYPKNSNRQQFYKRLSGKQVRRYPDLPSKGNTYRKIFDYPWILD